MLVLLAQGSISHSQGFWPPDDTVRKTCSGENGARKESKFCFLADMHLPAPAPLTPLGWTFPRLLAGLEPDYASDDLGAAAVDGQVAAKRRRADELAGGLGSGAQAVHHVIQLVDFGSVAG